MFKMALKSLLNRRKILLLVFLSLSLSVFLFLGVQRARELARASFSRTISGTDLIIGAPSGQVNLILYSVFHIGNAVKNMGYEAFRDIAAREEVAWSVPLSLGDSHQGYRVVGTTADYFRYYTYGSKRSLRFTAGEGFGTSPFSVVIGRNVARELDYKPGDRIVVSHGAGNATLAAHDNLPFTVTGILAVTGTPVDNSLFVPLEGITAIHIGWETGIRTRDATAAQALAADLTPSSITAMLVGLETRAGAFRFQREINAYPGEPLLAILPGAALYELWSIMGAAEQALALISGAVVFIGLLSLLAAQLAVLDQRRREMALLRSLGATPGRLFFFLLTESVIMTLAGCLSGVALLYLFQLLGGEALRTTGLYLEPALPSPAELTLLAITFVSGIVVGVVPAFLTYRRSLSDGLAVRS